MNLVNYARDSSHSQTEQSIEVDKGKFICQTEGFPLIKIKSREIIEKIQKVHFV